MAGVSNAAVMKLDRYTSMEEIQRMIRFIKGESLWQKNPCRSHINRNSSPIR